MDYSQKAFFIFGIMFSLLGGFLVFVSIMAGATPVFMTYTVIAMAIMSFCLSYLYPQFKQKDERMKLIRQKGMFYSYFALLFYYFVLLTVIQFDIVQITAIQVLNLLIALNIITVFISWVILSKFY
ncbi:permease [Peribacillus sp. NPDC096447]|uniref:permease n=1 Tax=Peribacillus sp. NPDC096447 TaxID=3364394 RepID=UPI0037F3C2D0